MSSVSTGTDRQRLRKFGYTVAIGFTVIGAVSWWRHHTVAPIVLWSLAVLNGVPALVAPKVLRPVERVWMIVGDYLGWINTRIILTALFYIVVTPAGLLMRLFRDPLDRELYETRASYWSRRAVTQFDSKTYERQF
jgi:hypothetical protein